MHAEFPDDPLASLPLPALREALAAHAPRHLRCAGPPPAPFRWEDLDFLVSTLDLSAIDPRRPPIRLVRGRAEQPLSELISEEGRGDLAGVRSTWHRGYTLVLNSVQRRLPALWALCRDLGRALGRDPTVNLYLTPAGEKGFEAHTDTQDALFLQVLGEKRWTVQAPGEAAETLTLEPGGLLYVPRGTLHQGRAGSAPSAHWSFALREGVSAAEEGPGWLEVPDLDLDTPLHRPEAQPWRVLRVGDAVVLDRLSASMRVPAAVEPALRAILERQDFTLRELPVGLDGPTRLTLGQLLLREGWIRRADGPRPPRRTPG